MTGFGGTTRRADAKQAILVKPVSILYIYVCTLV